MHVQVEAIKNAKDDDDEDSEGEDKEGSPEENSKLTVQVNPDSEDGEVSSEDGEKQPSEPKATSPAEATSTSRPGSPKSVSIPGSPKAEVVPTAAGEKVEPPKASNSPKAVPEENTASEEVSESGSEEDIPFIRAGSTLSKDDLLSFEHWRLDSDGFVFTKEQFTDAVARRFLSFQEQIPEKEPAEKMAICFKDGEFWYMWNHPASGAEIHELWVEEEEGGAVGPSGGTFLNRVRDKA